jgi:hypothetical protein
MALQPFVGHCRLFQFLDLFTQSVGLLGRGISPSQSRYLHTQDRENIEQTHTDIHVSSGIRTHDPSVRAGEDGSCFLPRGHCDRHVTFLYSYILIAPTALIVPPSDAMWPRC